MTDRESLVHELLTALEHELEGKIEPRKVRHVVAVNSGDNSVHVSLWSDMRPLSLSMHPDVARDLAAGLNEAVHDVDDDDDEEDAGGE